MPLDLITTEKGKPKLLDNGYAYVRDKESATGKTFWKCECSKKFKCHGRVHSRGDLVIHRYGDHNHAPDAAKIEADKVINTIKERAQNTQDGGHQIVSEAAMSHLAKVQRLVPHTPRLVLGTRTAFCKQVYTCTVDIR
jgi:FLYWCH zinc finger domain